MFGELVVGVLVVLERIVALLLCKDLCDRYQIVRGALVDFFWFVEVLDRGFGVFEILVGSGDCCGVLTESVFVGRGEEFGALEGVFVEVTVGGGGLVFLEGLSGFGKIWFVEKF